jgi:GH15 family glucan-1,4-alpha-glucosidase
VKRVVEKHAFKVADLEKCLSHGGPIDSSVFLHTRYTLEGEEVAQDLPWGNFQIDGYGTWIWSLLEHVRLSGDTTILQDTAEAIDTVVRYLCLIWNSPNYDCWEEHPEYMHSYTLGAVHAGLSAFLQMAELGLARKHQEMVKQTAEAVRAFLLQNGTRHGLLVKHIRPHTEFNGPAPVVSSGVDASMIALAVPYQTFALDDPIYSATVKAIERDLRAPGGGVYRFKVDTYYGGGEWLLLSAWLGWYYAQCGERSAAQELLTWIEQQADGNGNLPEQVSGHVLAPDYVDPWIRKWGPIASPLLWSHAMYIILAKALQEAK